MNFELLKDEIQAGLDGRNAGIPMGFNRLDKYIGLRKRIFTTVFGGTGTGKTAYVHNAYILQPFDYLQSVKNSNMKMKVILFSMERSKIYTLTKWLSRKIFLSEGILIPIPKLLGWWDVKLTKNEHDLVLQFEDYINELSEFVDIIEGAQNPTGKIRIFVKYNLSLMDKL